MNAQEQNLKDDLRRAELDLDHERRMRLTLERKDILLKQEIGAATRDYNIVRQEAERIKAKLAEAQAHIQEKERALKISEERKAHISEAEQTLLTKINDIKRRLSQPGHHQDDDNLRKVGVQSAKH